MCSHSGPAGFRYWRNLGGGLLDRPRSHAQIPAGIALGQPGVGFGDMGGDGQADLLVHSGSAARVLRDDSRRHLARRSSPTTSFPASTWPIRNVRLVDLTGDGRSDALMTRGDHFLWFECLGEKGFAPPKQIARMHDLDEFPDVFFDDPAGRVRFADMTGKRLNDIVLVHNGRIDYWPNLGYGRLRQAHHDGKRAPSRARLRSQTPVSRRSERDRLRGPRLCGLRPGPFLVQPVRQPDGVNARPSRELQRVSDVDSVQFADVFGTGTATLLWSYDIRAQPGGQLQGPGFLRRRRSPTCSPK